MLVGKGITFDTGGLSIKPRDAMMSMKRDMTGAGVVLSVMAALSAVDCPVRVTGLLPLAENSVGADSIRPGDVLRHYGGRTSEVTNTDAEGRLVLADALAYAVAEVRPDVLVDVATLTGAVKMALGQRTGGLFATDDRLADRLRTASLAADEPLWRLPLTPDYEDRISSKVADADNAGGAPGAITAALFLQHFTGGLPWAHLDIASVGDSPVDAFEYTPGATGFGARLLLHWLSDAAHRSTWAPTHEQVAVHALTVRWSLADAPAGAGEALAAYVHDTSHARFSAKEGLRFKTWRTRPGSGSRAATSSTRTPRAPPSRRLHRHRGHLAGLPDRRLAARAHRGLRRGRRGRGGRRVPGRADVRLRRGAPSPGARPGRTTARTSRPCASWSPRANGHYFELVLPSTPGVRRRHLDPADAGGPARVRRVLRVLGGPGRPGHAAAGRAGSIGTYLWMVDGPTSSAASRCGTP